MMLSGGLPSQWQFDTLPGACLKWKTVSSQLPVDQRQSSVETTVMPVVPERLFGCQGLQLAQRRHHVVLSPIASLAKKRFAVSRRPLAERHGPVRRILHVVEGSASLRGCPSSAQVRQASWGAQRKHQHRHAGMQRCIPRHVCMCSKRRE